MKLGKMLNEVLIHLGKKPSTILYPFERIEVPDQYRGKVVHHGSFCTGCRLCEKDCPADAITIIDLGDKRYSAKFDFNRCIYCAQCVESCHKDALSISSEYELAEIDPVATRLTIYELL